MASLTVAVQLEMLARIAVAAVLAAALGWERQLNRQPAGLRTHMLVSLGAAGYTIAGIIGVAGNGTVQDAGRIAAQIVTGIGFVCAGAIWRSDQERLIRGLTTAASIWVAASIGMLCGYGLYVLALACAALSLFVLRVLQGAERLPDVLLTSVRRSAEQRRAVTPPASATQADAAAILVPPTEDGALAALDNGALGDAPVDLTPDAAPHRGKRVKRKKGGKHLRTQKAALSDSRDSTS